MTKPRWHVYDPFSATAGVYVVAKNFHTRLAAEVWLKKHAAANPDGFNGCYVVSDDELAQRR